MTKISEIEQQLDREVGEWYQKVYDVNLPDTFLTVFNRCLLNVPPVLHNLPAKYLKELRKKPLYELTRADVAVMLQIIFNSPIGHYNEDEEEVFNLLERLGEIRTQYNRETQHLAKVMAEKFKTRASLSGIIMDKKVTSYNAKVQVV